MHATRLSFLETPSAQEYMHMGLAGVSNSIYPFTLQKGNDKEIVGVIFH